MRIKLWGDWFLSINLTKGKYSSCLNPHIGILYDRYLRSWNKKTKDLRWVCEKKKFFYFEFPQHWIFNIEWDRKKRKLHYKYVPKEYVMGWSFPPFRLSMWLWLNYNISLYKRSSKYGKDIQWTLYIVIYPFKTKSFKLAHYMGNDIPNRPV